METFERTILILAFLLTSTQAAQAQTNVVLVELFTSQGCSSCPPADELLYSLNNQANVVTISEHVDYWNYLGWKDPFSDKLFSERQRGYADSFNLKGVYTPQAIVDGKYQLNGASRRSLYSAISKARSNKKQLIKISTKQDGENLNINVKLECPMKTGILFLVLTEDGLQSKVSSGENAGRYLKHNSVARIMLKRSLDGTPNSVSKNFQIKINSSWNRKCLKLVAFVQDDRSKEVKALGHLAL